MITINQIQDFSSVYPAYKNLLNNSLLWNALQSCTLSRQSLNHIINCNDTRHIPPAETFLQWCSIHCPNTSTILHGNNFRIKQSIGMYWRFIFRDLLQYDTQKKGVKNVTLLSSGTIYMNKKAHTNLKS